MKDTVPEEAPAPSCMNGAQSIPAVPQMMAGCSAMSKDAVDLDLIQMMVKQLNTEISSFKQSSDVASQQDDTSKSDENVSQIKATTDSLNLKIAQMRKQIELHKAFMKEQTEDIETQSKAKDTSLDGIKESIATLKVHMESISAHPIAEIYPQEVVDKLAAESAASKSNGAGADQVADGDKESNSDKPPTPHVNAKAKDDLLKKYLLLKVLRENLKVLTAKMNSMMKSQGIEPTSVEAVAASKASTTQDAVEQNSTAETTQSANGETNPVCKEEPKVNDDEYYMYADEDVEEELYQEENQEGSQVSEIKAEEQGKELVDTHIAEVNGSLETNETAVETTTDTNPQGTPEVSTNQDVVNEEQNELTSSDQTVPNPKPEISSLYESSALADAEAFLKNYKTKVKAEEEQEAKAKNTIADSSKVRTYSLLLKLQKEMADMQLQMSRLQDHVRSTNAALQTIFDHEFSDME